MHAVYNVSLWVVLAAGLLSLFNSFRTRHRSMLWFGLWALLVSVPRLAGVSSGVFLVVAIASSAPLGYSLVLMKRESVVRKARANKACLGTGSG